MLPVARGRLSQRLARRFCRYPAVGQIQRFPTTSGGAMHWSDIENTQPRLAGPGRQRLLGPGVVLVAKIRRDGTARLSPVEPLVMDGDLWLSMMWRSTKARDLLRDPRILMHSVVTGRDGAEESSRSAAPPPWKAIRRCSGATPTWSRAASAGTRSPAGSTCSPSTSARSLHQLRHGNREPARGHLAAGPRVHPPGHVRHQRGRPRAGKRADPARLTGTPKSVTTAATPACPRG